AVINNIEEDHLDYYTGGLPEIVASFARFASQVRPEGLLVLNGADANVRDALKQARPRCRVETFALEDADADWTAAALRPTRGLFRFQARHAGRSLGTFELVIPGRHNVSNALAALACCTWAGVDADAVRASLAKFRGAERRFQLVGERSGVTVVDDYAHHPSEIRETLRGARAYFGTRRIVVIFQPHQHSRTRFLLADFARAFDDADLVIVPEIYFVRDSEDERQQVTSSDLVRAMRTHGKECLDLATFDEIEARLRKELRAGDVVITMGAGDVYKVGRRLVEKGRGVEGQATT
ncbi:MAG TPA: cyanophycin synthetase, partial [Planctomycetota bacterium]|nr:cyanophycin synthetase [Planctomycetota bacterium]